MIKNNQKVFNRMHVAMDAVIMIISYALAYFIKFYILDADTIGVGVLPPKDYFVVLFFVVQFFSSLEYTCMYEWLGVSKEIVHVVFILCSYFPLLLLKREGGK